MTSFTRLPRTQLLVGISIAIHIGALFANELVLGDEGDGDAAGWIGLSLFGIALTAVLVLVALPRLRGDNRRTAVLAFGGARRRGSPAARARRLTPPTGAGLLRGWS